MENKDNTWNTIRYVNFDFIISIIAAFLSAETMCCNFCMLFLQKNFME